MEAQRFDHVTRHLSRGTARRRLVAGLALSPFAGLVTRSADDVAAKKKRKKKGKNKKAKKAQPNSYGCLDVGKACGGESSACCSGVCEGSKPKKGKPDKSRCVKHDASFCRVDFDICTTGSTHVCNNSSEFCQCTLTTGNAPFCGDLEVPASGVCQACSQDTDCKEEFGAGAACVVLAGICDHVCPESGGAVCMPPLHGCGAIKRPR